MALWVCVAVCVSPLNYIRNSSCGYKARVAERGKRVSILCGWMHVHRRHFVRDVLNGEHKWECVTKPTVGLLSGQIHRSTYTTHKGKILHHWPNSNSFEHLHARSRRSINYKYTIIIELVSKVGPTQPPVQWVPRNLSPAAKRGRGVTLTSHPRLVPRSWMSRSYTSSPPYASIDLLWKLFFLLL
jgi:hypothetical protein